MFELIVNGNIIDKLYRDDTRELTSQRHRCSRFYLPAWLLLITCLNFHLMHERRNIEMNGLCSDPVVTLLGVAPARDPSRRNVTVFKNVKCEN